MRGWGASLGSLALLALPLPALAQDGDGAPAPAAPPPPQDVLTGDMPPPMPTDMPLTEEQVDAALPPERRAAASPGGQVYTPADFARFAPRTALDMLNQVPGFRIREGDEVRGLGQADTNVLINGERLALKSETVFDRLNKIPAANVVRIEIVDGATLNIPGLSGQVANIVTEATGMTGRFSWEPRFRPGYVRPRWFGGSVSVSGTAGKLDYTLGLANSGGTGSTKGPTEITDRNGDPVEHRDAHLTVMNNYPKISGTLKWDGPGSSVGNFNASYERGYFDLRKEEVRTRPDGADSTMLYDPRERSYNYEIGGDYEFALGPGRLKLIGLERYSHVRYREDFVITPVDGSPAHGSRYTNMSESGERIGRGEYSWKMLGGDWQLAAEAAFNRYDGEAHLFDLAPTGEFVEIPFPFGTGGVTEDRYESILTYGRKLGDTLSLQLGAGGEYSKIAQTGPQGLTRRFFRPKGSASLAWTPAKGTDISLKLARVVGQLAFSDFLARVDLDQGNGSAGNVELVPPQSWELDFEIKQDLGRWGSTTLKLYANWYEDYIDWIVLPGPNPGELVEARGNIETASLYGIDWTSTINLDPVGWTGAKLDMRVNVDDPSIVDPLTGERRAFSGWNDTYINGNLRYDIPKSDWAVGLGFEKYHANPYHRLRETGLDYEGPVYTFGFVENKDVLGLTVRLNVFNLTNGRHIVHRTVYEGPRNDSPVLFHEDTDEGVGLIYNVTIRGTF